MGKQKDEIQEKTKEKQINAISQKTTESKPNTNENENESTSDSTF